MVLRISIGRPIHMLLVEPIVLPTATMAGLTQAIVFVFYVAYPLIFQRLYGFTTRQVGYSFSPLLVGNFLAIAIMGITDKRIYQVAKAKAEQSGSLVLPELRLVPAMVGSILMPISLFW